MSTSTPSPSSACERATTLSERFAIALKVQGKADVERYTTLSQTAAETLVEYYRAFRPVEWLFESRGGGVGA
jgi:integrase